MPAHTYRWLSEILDAMLPQLESMPPGQEGRAFAQSWFQQLLQNFTDRGLTTPYQQRNHVVSTRRAIEQRLGDNHPSLAVVGFDEATWQKVGLLLHDRAEVRSENQRLIRDPDLIVAKAEQLLGSDDMAEVAAGLGVVIGRRFNETLDPLSRFDPKTPWSILFTGQRKTKHKGELTFEIPTLVAAELVLSSLARMKSMLGGDFLTDKQRADRYGRKVSTAADLHFRALLPADGLVTPGEQEDVKGEKRSVYFRLFRAVYATIAVHYYCPPRINAGTYKSEIQGHREVFAAPTPEMRRNYASRRYYDYYQIASADGKNIDGRQGIRFEQNLTGLELLDVFRPHESEPQPTAQTPSPMTPPPPTAPPPAVKTKRAAPKTYRIHVEDMAKLEEDRKLSDAPPSQQDYLHDLLELVGQAGTFKRGAARTEKAEAECATARQELAEVEAENRRFSDILRAVSPKPTDFAALAGFAKELLDLAIETNDAPTKQKLLAMASRALGGPEAAAFSRPNPTASTPPTPPAVHETLPPSAATPPAHSAPTSPDASPATAKGNGSRGTDRLELSVQALMRHNDAQQKPQDKWAITASVLARLAGSFRPLIRTYLAEHAQQIETHHHRHDLIADKHNYVHRGQSPQIEQILASELDWLNQSAGSEQEPAA